MEFVDLQAQRARISTELETALRKVLEHGRFILGPEVRELEDALCRFTGSRFCISSASGTDALLMVLMAWGIGPGDAVFVPAFTFPATAEVVLLLGATPVFVDVDEHTFNIAAPSLVDAVEMVQRTPMRPAVVVGVDLYGLPADWLGLRELATRYELKLLADAAQSLGGGTPAGRVGTLADATATSFFPAKPLGCYGDGGAIFTDDELLAQALVSIRGHGQGSEKYEIVRVGVNSRLDTLQAAVLLEKLRIFEDELAARREIAAYYSSALGECDLVVPSVPIGFLSAWAQYTIKTRHRQEVRTRLQAQGVPTAIYYPQGLHHQLPYRNQPTAPGGLAVSDRLADGVLSLPMHPYLSQSEQERVISALCN